MYNFSTEIFPYSVECFDVLHICLFITANCRLLQIFHNFKLMINLNFSSKTRAVLVFATKRKNNVDPRPRIGTKCNINNFAAK